LRGKRKRDNKKLMDGGSSISGRKNICKGKGRPAVPQPGVEKNEKRSRA